ncbi:MAG: phosphoribosyl 1,2-cyclic phosphate phosphodiesterase [Bacteroidia bacterium]
MPVQKKYKITFLGTGTSQGVPLIGCICAVCCSENVKDKRLRSSILVETSTTSIVIDTGPDFRQQMLKSKVNKLDAVVFTHGHKDHTAGFDDIRAFNYIQQKDMEVYCDKRVEDVLRKDFDYVFADLKYPGVPKANLHRIDGSPFEIGDIQLIPIELKHFKLPVYGFRIGDFTYITDANYISDTELDKVRGSKMLTLNALRKESHISHFTLDQAIALSKELKADHTYFTHISHQLGLNDTINKDLGQTLSLAHDGLVIHSD